MSTKIMTMGVIDIYNDCKNYAKQRNYKKLSWKSYMKNKLHDARADNNLAYVLVKDLGSVVV